METIALKINGMRCQHCAESVTKALEPFAAKIAIDLDGGKATFEYDPQKTDLEKIKAAIDDAGFEAVD
ncbi:MAG: heavy-metal-associated domain-containing protein [Helicobacteraceae bacterium]|jgi:copper chaperone CopZ|nr:heavy-metal-associated domain-containing protein [Helicobacteraceae bacterium]